MSDFFDAVDRLAASVVQQISSRSATSNARDFLTNPVNGLQTLAGKSFQAILQAYGDVKAGGRNSPAVIAATIAALETVRSGFEAKVRSLGPDFWVLAGMGGVSTINSVAAQMIGERRAELAQLTGTDPGAAAAAGGVAGQAADNSTTVLIFVLIAAGFLLVTLGKRG